VPRDGRDECLPKGTDRLKAVCGVYTKITPARIAGWHFKGMDFHQLPPLAAPGNAGRATICTHAFSYMEWLA